METSKWQISEVLLADDDEEDILFFREALSIISTGFTFAFEKNGQNLLKRLEVNVPDLLFLDLHMPVINGNDCLLRIRSNKKLDLLPVIIYSTSSHLNSIDECYRNGANGYIIKPFSFDNIIVALMLSLQKDWKTEKIREQFLVNS